MHKKFLCLLCFLCSFPFYDASTRFRCSIHQRRWATPSLAAGVSWNQDCSGPAASHPEGLPGSCELRCTIVPADRPGCGDSRQSLSQPRHSNANPRPHSRRDSHRWEQLRACEMVSRSHLQTRDFNAGREVVLFGRVDFDRYESKFVFFNPEFELLDEGDDSTSLDIGRFVPIYEEAGRYHQPSVAAPRRCGSSRSCKRCRRIRCLTRYAARHDLPDLRSCFDRIHFPLPEDDSRTIQSASLSVSSASDF